MTSVISFRLPTALERAVRGNASKAKMDAADIIRLILEHSIGGQFDFSTLPDVPQPLDAKLDVRLSAETVQRLRAESQRLNTSVSVYSRMILYAYYTKRIIFIEIEGRYTLAENHDQKKSAGDIGNSARIYEAG
jgi:predicted DNA-binding protein